MFLRGGMLVSNKPTELNASPETRVTSMAVMTGGSPTTASNRPPDRHWFCRESGRNGSDPVSRITS